MGLDLTRLLADSEHKLSNNIKQGADPNAPHREARDIGDALNSAGISGPDSLASSPAKTKFLKEYFAFAKEKLATDPHMSKAVQNFFKKPDSYIDGINFENGEYIVALDKNEIVHAIATNTKLGDFDLKKSELMEHSYLVQKHLAQLINDIADQSSSIDGNHKEATDLHKAEIDFRKHIPDEEKRKYVFEPFLGNVKRVLQQDPHMNKDNAVTSLLNDPNTAVIGAELSEDRKSYLIILQDDHQRQYAVSEKTGHFVPVPHKPID